MSWWRLPRPKAKAAKRELGVWSGGTFFPFPGPKPLGTLERHERRSLYEARRRYGAGPFLSKA